MTTAYGSQYPVLIGTAGITWELPVYSDISAEYMVPYGLMTQAMFIRDNKISMLENQAKLFSRGVNNTNSNADVAPWYVNQYDETGAQAELMRVPCTTARARTATSIPSATSSLWIVTTRRTSSTPLRS